MERPFIITRFANMCCQMINRLQNQHILQRISPITTASYARELHWRRSLCTTASSTSPKDKLYRQITVEVKGHDSAVLNSYQKFTTTAAEHLGVKIASISEPPKVITRKSLLKSVFIFKKHQHQYETRTLFRVFELKHLTESTALTFLEYIQRNLPEGMAMKVTKHELQGIPAHLKPPKLSQVETSSSSPSPQIPS